MKVFHDNLFLVTKVPLVHRLQGRNEIKTIFIKETYSKFIQDNYLFKLRKFHWFPG